MSFIDDLALLVGRLLMAALLLPSGFKKITDLGGTTAMLGRMGVPYPDILAIVGAVVEAGTPILLILGLLPRITAILAGGFVLAATLIAHRFWEFPDAGAQAMQQIQFLKNMGIVGGLMFYFVAGPGRFALGKKG